jgi:hypothetical protein
VAPDISSSAAISLKNLCKKHWAHDDSVDFIVCEADKQFLKASMLAGAQSNFTPPPPPPPPPPRVILLLNRHVRLFPPSLRVVV